VSKSNYNDQVFFLPLFLLDTWDRAMAQAITCWLLNAEVRVRPYASPCRIRDGKSGSRTAFGSTCQHHFTNAPLLFIYLSTI